jgi:hypothetical protein
MRDKLNTYSVVIIISMISSSRPVLIPVFVELVAPSLQRTASGITTAKQKYVYGTVANNGNTVWASALDRTGIYTVTCDSRRGFGLDTRRNCK